MSLARAMGTIGGLTLVSRIFGFARDMLLARILGAGLAADCFQLAFRLPNTFRRLFAEGAFSAAYVPMFSRALQGPGGHDEAERFSQDVLSVFVPVLIGFTALFELGMSGFVWLLANDFQQVPGKFELAVTLSRIAFPYLFFISIVSLLTGILNSLSRFAAGAAAPILFNLTLISGLLFGSWLRGPDGSDLVIAYVQSGAVALSGFVQLVWLWYWTKKSGFRLTIRRPVFTPQVRELGRIILPATFGAGIYQISQLVDTFFATRLPQGSLTHLAMADRLNQMPLGVIGIALGTAILPALSRHIAREDEGGASKVQSDAIELAMLLTLPAAVALMVCAGPFVSAFFVGGRFTPEDGIITSQVVIALVAGLPAYVLVKLLTPGFFARKDTKTPVKTALVVLIFNIAVILVVIGPFGIVGLASATAAASWLNCALLYSIQHKRGHYRLHAKLLLRLGRQLIAAAVMAAALFAARDPLLPYFAGGVIERAVSVLALVLAGVTVYFATAWAIGAIDRDRIAILQRKKAL
ncbi:murein biosynthesis integral membrane protein MurJ [Rhizorhapis sp. SPR117]|uniref:murein biosynthesis integral membrane protein MurJ n=1 Tax=Rhizorhapis sp. SPR117 TaxID=2912611 RepID=UPI001F00230C|nr:murein biosynthesis integral membrane protein MurJ [Rhizorhapis sp. SPR117]